MKIADHVPDPKFDPRRIAKTRAGKSVADYMGLETKISRCWDAYPLMLCSLAVAPNSRVSDLRLAASLMKDRQVSPHEGRPLCIK